VSAQFHIFCLQLMDYSTSDLESWQKGSLWTSFVICLFKTYQHNSNEYFLKSIYHWRIQTRRPVSISSQLSLFMTAEPATELPS